VLLRCSSESVKQAPDLPPRPASGEEKGEMVVSSNNDVIMRIILKLPIRIQWHGWNINMYCM